MEGRSKSEVSIKEEKSEVSAVDVGNIVRLVVLGATVTILVA